MTLRPVSAQTLQRLPLYVSYLKSLPAEGAANVSATAIADALGLNDVQVRKDLASVSDSGRPKIGYITRDLVAEIENYLGCNDANCAVIAGVGKLGRALISYGGFSAYGLNIVAAFDVADDVVGTVIAGKQVFPLERLEELCRRMHVRIGIIAVPSAEAQSVCDAYVRSGIRAVWNFAPTYLNVPDDVLVQSENMAYSLAVLSKHLLEMTTCD